MEKSRKTSTPLQHDSPTISKSVNTIAGSSSTSKISNSPRKDFETASPTTVHLQKAKKTTTKLGQQHSPHRHSSPNTKFVCSGNNGDGVVGKTYSEKDCSVLTTTTTAVATSNVLPPPTPPSVALALADAPQGKIISYFYFSLHA